MLVSVQIGGRNVGRGSGANGDGSDDGRDNLMSSIKIHIAIKIAAIFLLRRLWSAARGLLWTNRFVWFLSTICLSILLEKGIIQTRNWPFNSYIVKNYLLYFISPVLLLHICTSWLTAISRFVLTLTAVLKDL